MDKFDKRRALKGNNFEQKQERFLFLTELLHRYFSGTVNKKEIEVIDAWDAEASWSAHTQKINNEKSIGQSEELWDKIAAQLHFGSKPLRKTTRLKQQAIIRYSSIAAMFILLLGGAYYFTMHQNDKTTGNKGLMANAYTNIYTTNAETKQITLPDGTHIHLNRGSELKYIAGTYNKHQREIWLHGEAFFEVAKHPYKMFIVHTGDIRTVVHGTSFNIKAYRELDENSISVRDGKVEIFNASKNLGILTKNMQLTYTIANQKPQIEELNWENAAGWMEGKIVFNNADIKEIRLRIKQNFGFEMYIKGNTLNDIHCNAGFEKGANAKLVFNRICAMYNVKYEIKGNKVIFSDL